MSPTSTHRKPDPQETGELHQFGYKQQLRRSMGGFSSFAISFSLISIITGIFANFGYGLKLVGPAIIWSWSLVGLGQFFVALVMADLSTRFPITGYGYQWTSRLINPHFGYFVGWLLLMQFLTGFPGVCQALADTIYGLTDGGASGSWMVTWITVAIISLITLIHLYGIRIVAIVNNLGVYTEISGSVLITIILLGIYFLAGEIDFSVLLKSVNIHSGTSAGFSAFALSLLMGAWCLTGFEAAADLAEETRQPRKIVPRAIITSQLSAAIGGFLMLLALLLSIDNLTAVQQSDAPMMMILESALGSRGTSLISLMIIFSILACGVASMATASRLIYSMARDNMLPFSHILKQVHKTFRVPRAASILVWFISCTFVIFVRHLELITTISAVAGYLGYSGILIAAFYSKPDKNDSMAGFSLKKWRWPVQITAFLWTLLVVAALTVPAQKIEGYDATHLPAISTIASVVVGIAIYFFLIRKKIRMGFAGPPLSGYNPKKETN